MGKPLYIAVFSNQDRNFGEFDHGYLPLFNAILITSYDKNLVLDRIYSTFYNNKEYEVIDVVNGICDDGDNEPTFTIKYTDNRYDDVYAIYTLEVLKEYIE